MLCVLITSYIGPKPFGLLSNGLKGVGSKFESYNEKV